MPPPPKKKTSFWNIIYFWPLLIWALLPNLTFYLIVQGFHRTYATGAACQQRTLTPPDTWSSPTLGLVCVLMSRPIYPELVLSPDFWISNIPRYFSFAITTIYNYLFKEAVQHGRKGYWCYWLFYDYNDWISLPIFLRNAFNIKYYIQVSRGYSVLYFQQMN